MPWLFSAPVQASAQVLMSDPFASSKYCLAWARSRVAELEREIGAFKERKPYAAITETDTDTGDQIHKIVITEAVPFPMPGLASDAGNNLRFALDHALYAVTRLSGINVKSAYFPFSKNVTDFNTGVDGRCKGLHDDLRETVRSFKAYKGGNNLLWALNELCNTQKHALISPVMSSTVSMNISEIQKGSAFVPVPIWDRVKNEMVLARVPVGSNFKAKFEIEIEIAISNVEFIRDEPVIATLNKLGPISQNVVTSLEETAKKLGLC